MFSKKVATADYAPSGNILCCCGFFNTKRKRRQSCDVIGDNEDKKDEQSKENGSILSNGGSDHPPTYDSITADEKGRTKSLTSLDKNGKLRVGVVEYLSTFLFCDKSVILIFLQYW